MLAWKFFLVVEPGLGQLIQNYLREIKCVGMAERKNEHHRTAKYQ